MGAMPAPSHAFVLPIVVEPEDIDELDHVNNVVYLRWAQDAAIAHWDAVAAQDLRKRVHWVVTKHEIEYRQPARFGDTVLVATWIGAIRRTFCERFTETRRQSDGKVLAKTRSWWCLIDSAAGSPITISDELEGFTAPEDAGT